MNAIRSAENGSFQAVVFDELKKLDYPAERLNEAHFFIQAFFERIAPADHALHAPDRWAALIADLLAFARERVPGKAKVRVYNPGVSGSRAVVEVVTDDMPFLVDTVSMVAAAHADIHATIHPVVPVLRSATGVLESMGSGSATESIMRFEIDRLDDTELDTLKANVETALADVREAVTDWRAMRDKMLDVAGDLGKRSLPYTAEEVREASEFLRWVADDHFTFMGYREYEVAADAGDQVLKTVEGSGLGILRTAERSLAPRSLRTLVASELPRSGSTDAIILTKTNARSPIHRAGYMDYVGVLKFDGNGRPVAEQRFLGLFSSNAYMAHPQHVPLVREKCEAVMTRSGLKRDSHSGKALRHILDTLPREELFQCSTDELYVLATGLLELAQRTRTRLFIRRDSYGRFFSCLVYIPRDRFNTNVRERVESVLREAFHGEHVDSAVLMGEAALVRLHVVVRPRIGDHPVYDAAAIESQIVAIARNWYDDLRDRLIEVAGEQQGIILANRYGKALPAGYVDEVSPQVAAADVRALAGLDGPDAISMSFYHPPHRPEELRFKVYRSGSDIALSEVLPQLENLGLRVLTEHMYEVKIGDGSLFVQDFEVQPVGRLAFEVEQVGSLFEDAFEQIWRGNAENDGFNRLVLGAKLGWRQVAVLRSYCKYLLQTGVAFSQAYMEDALNHYPAIAGLIIELFNARFDPRRESLDGDERARAESLLSHEMHTLMDTETLAAHPGLIGNLVAALSRPREEQVAAVEEAINALLDNVSSLDEDRILRSFIALVHATLRTSYFQAWDGTFRPYISFKFDSHRVPDLAKPVPFREIFVYAPRVEGIHLRFGSVARGGLRWSDRREDFRTEVLGLVKAQMVKNTVIVPVGSKGGFFVKRPPVGGDRDAQLAEGIACYRMFINGLLDITDNLVEGKVVPPHDVVRHDQDDPYLVVAADKGTATFSDIANAISTEHGFWLDDAFASGGSNGYDHKGMGITAKGAWESVKRHFRALGRDCQTQDFTVVGVGDMSGDVFGNGMLLSRHIRLLAAFDHRHIFLDPSPDAATSFAERERLFNLPRSSWADYDRALISPGGGIFPRTVKSIALTPEVRAMLDVTATEMAPNDLLHAILKAPADLLYNGGIGTYIKASTETHAQVGDRANDGLRVNGAELRCKVVAEGGNLGCTQLGRIEYAQHGGRINTDAIDNSAGVDCSDHEVNIKILLGLVVADGEMTLKQRNTLLAEMTDEVGELVLRDNYFQTQALSLARTRTALWLDPEARLMRYLERGGRLNRAIEFLPVDEDIDARRASGGGLTTPERAVLMAYSKMWLYDVLLGSDLPDQPFVADGLPDYFPKPLHTRCATSIPRHTLRREILATMHANALVNRAGVTFVHRMAEETGAEPLAVVWASLVARAVYRLDALWQQVDALDAQVPHETQTALFTALAQLHERATLWFLRRRVTDVPTAVEHFRSAVDALAPEIDALQPEESAQAAAQQRQVFIEAGVPEALARVATGVPARVSLLDIAEVATVGGCDARLAARVYFALDQPLGYGWLQGGILGLPTQTHWQMLARATLLEELGQLRRRLTQSVLQGATPGASADGLIDTWRGTRQDALARYNRVIADQVAAGSADLAMLSVGLKALAEVDA